MNNQEFTDIVHNNYVIRYYPPSENNFRAKGIYSAYSQLLGTNAPDFERYTSSLEEIMAEIDNVNKILNRVDTVQCIVINEYK